VTRPLHATAPPRLAAALALLLAPVLSGFSPLEVEEPNVRRGNERLAGGDAAAALQQYDAAEQAAGPRPEIDFDRGNALQAQGKSAEAREAWKKALEADAKGQGRLASRALQNMGNALDAMGDRDGAVRSFSEALRRDPANEDARYNLEVLLRRRDGGKGAPRDPGEQGQQEPKQGPRQEQAGQQPKPGEPPRANEGQPPPEAPPQQPQRPQPGDGKDEGRREREAGAKAGEQAGQRQEPAGPQGERQPGEQAAEGRGTAGDLDRRDAERILDALRSRERPMPLGPAGRTDARRRDVEKDW